MLLKYHNLITWILIKNRIQSRDLAKVCNFILIIPKIIETPIGWISFIRRNRFIPNRLSNNPRIVMLDRIAS